MEKDTLKVKVKTIKNEIYELEVAKDIEINNFKTEIEKVSNIEKGLIRIIYKGKQLKEGDTLDKFIKQDGETVHLIKGVPKAPEPAQQQTDQTTNNNPNLANTIPLNNNAPQPPQMQHANDLFGNMGNIFGMMQGMMPPGNNMPQQPAPPMPNQLPTNNSPNQGPIFQRLTTSNGTNAIHIQSTTQQRPATNLRPANQSPFGVASLNDQAMHLNFPPIEGQNLNTESPVTYSLEHSQLHNCASHLTRINPSQGTRMFAPDVPRLTGERNSLSLLGNYLRLLTSQLENVNPVLRRAADLLERENLMQGRSRVDFGEFSHNVGNALNCLANGITSVAPLMRDLRLTGNVGEFGVVGQQRNTDPSRVPPMQPTNTPSETARVDPQANQAPPNQQANPNPPTNAQSNPQVNVQINGQPGNINEIFGNIDIGSIMQNLGPMMGQQAGENPSQGNPLGNIDLNSIMQNLGPIMGQMGMQNPPQEAQPNAPQNMQAQPNPNNVPQNPQENTNQQQPQAQVISIDIDTQVIHDNQPDANQDAGQNMNQNPLGGMINNLLGPGGMNEIQNALQGNNADPQVQGLVNAANSIFANLSNGQGGGMN